MLPLCRLIGKSEIFKIQKSEPWHGATRRFFTSPHVTDHKHRHGMPTTKSKALSACVFESQETQWIFCLYFLSIPNMLIRVQIFPNLKAQTHQFWAEMTEGLSWQYCVWKDFFVGTYTLHAYTHLHTSYTTCAQTYVPCMHICTHIPHTLPVHRHMHPACINSHSYPIHYLCIDTCTLHAYVPTHTPIHYLCTDILTLCVAGEVPVCFCFHGLTSTMKLCLVFTRFLLKLGLGKRAQW